MSFSKESPIIVIEGLFFFSFRFLFVIFTFWILHLCQIWQTEQGLVTLENQNGNVLEKNYNRALLKRYIASDNAHNHGETTSEIEEEIITEDVNSHPSMDEENPAEVVEMILLNSGRTSDRAWETYHNIIRTWSNLILKSLTCMVKIYVRKLIILFSQGSGLLLRIK